MKKISLLIIGMLIGMSMLTINKIINVSYSVKNLNLENNHLITNDSSLVPISKIKHLVAPLPIDSDDVNYFTDQSTDLLSGLISNAGNTKKSYIVEIKSSSSLYIKLRLNMLDLKKSFLIRGTVNNNNFIENKNIKTLLIKRQLILSNEGIYHFYLSDIFGNSYNSFLEIGEDNWKLKGTFNKNYLALLSQKLNIQKTEKLLDDTKKEEAIGWLQNYKSYISMKFYCFVQMYGKGFDFSVKKDFSNIYTRFLKQKDYIDNTANFTTDFIKENTLQDDIIKKATKKLQDSLGKLRNLNIDTRNVVDKETLNSFKKWRKDYYNFIIHHKDKWINRIGKIASRGYANDSQMEEIRNHLNRLYLPDFLKPIIWRYQIGKKYHQFLNLDKLQNDIIDWVNKTITSINWDYQNAIKKAESHLNFHGYRVKQILNGRHLPSTKFKIRNYADEESFHDWLQQQANIKFNDWQIAIAFDISVPLLIVIIAGGIFIFWHKDSRYNPLARAKKYNKNKNKYLKLLFKFQRKELTKTKRKNKKWQV